jgi:hypothetical protein
MQRTHHAPEWREVRTNIGTLDEKTLRLLFLLYLTCGPMYRGLSFSGLRGVDVGSLPMIREWVKDVIRETLLEYVAPKYIAIDVAAWLTSAPICPQ